MKWLLFFGMFSIGQFALADEYVHGYVRKNGTYVQGYHRTDPDNTTINNYSNYGNVNPYTGHIGTHHDTYTTPSYTLPTYQVPNYNTDLSYPSLGE